MSGDILQFGLERFSALILASFCLAVGLAGCDPAGRRAKSPEGTEAVNLTTQAGSQTIDGVSLVFRRTGEASGDLYLKGGRNQLLVLKGGPQFSVVRTALDGSAKGEDFFVASTRSEAEQIRHIGWVVTLGENGWEVVELPFTSKLPIRPPVDINGDGRREFVIVDADYSTVSVESQSVTGPETYYIVKDGEVIDQTAHSQYADRREMKRELAHTACTLQRTFEACSTYAAWAAQSRRLDEAWPVVLQMLATDPISYCRIAEAIVPCATGQQGSVSLSAAEAVQLGLSQRGYIRPVFIDFPDETDTSFGCDHARTFAERTICSDEGLRALERREVAAVSRHMALSADRTSVFDAHMSFLAQRNRTVGVLALTQLYEQRLTRLES